MDPPRSSVITADFPVMNHLREAAFLLAERDPVSAVRTLARALRRQTTGARLMIVRRLVEALEEHEAGALQAVTTDLAKIVGD